MHLHNCHNFHDFRRLAKRRLPGPIFDYIDGAADDEVTYRRNTQAFEACDLVRRGTVDIVAVGRFGHEANEGRSDLGDRQGEVDVVSSQCVLRHHRDTRVTGILNDRGAPGVFDRAQALGTVAAAARKDDSDGAGATPGRHRPERHVDRRSGEVDGRSCGHA